MPNIIIRFRTSRLSLIPPKPEQWYHKQSTQQPGFSTEALANVRVK